MSINLFSGTTHDLSLIKYLFYSIQKSPVITLRIYSQLSYMYMYQKVQVVKLSCPAFRLIHL